MNWRTMIVPAAMAGVLGLAACEEAGTTDLAPPFAEAVAFHPDAVDYRPVTVKGAGADPKQQLYFDPWPGEQYRVTRVSAAWVSDKMDRQGVGEGNRPIKEVSFLIEVREVFADRITAAIGIEYAGLAPVADMYPLDLEAETAKTEALVGSNGVITWSRNGMLLDVTMLTAPGAEAHVMGELRNVASAFHTAALPTPKEAVGPGARWSSGHPRTRIGTMLSDNAYEATLWTVSPESASVDHVFKAEVPNQEAESFNRDGEPITVQLRDGHTESKGRLTYDLRGLPIGTGELTLLGRQGIYVPTAIGRQEWRRQSRATVTWTVERVEGGM
jgi:hypothetical protein